MLTFAPAASSLAFNFSASSLDSRSFMTFGTASTKSLASLMPKPLFSRTALMTVIFLAVSKPSSTTLNSVVMEGFDTAKKIGIIKAVRENTGFGIKEAKDFVEAVPKVVNDRLPKADAEKLKAKLEAAGAKVSLKPVVE